MEIRAMEVGMNALEQNSIPMHISVLYLEHCLGVFGIFWSALVLSGEKRFRSQKECRRT
jgi:hypothetical protein